MEFRKLKCLEQVSSVTLSKFIVFIIARFITVNHRILTLSLVNDIGSE